MLLSQYKAPDPYNLTQERLNPCCSGCCSRSDVKVDEWLNNPEVSILVVVDVALAGLQQRPIR